MYLSALDRTKAELRPSSIMGAIRFWWRALEWSRCDGSIERLREREARVFGSTGQQAEALIDVRQRDELTTELTRPFPAFSTIAYLGYGLHPQTDNRNAQDRYAFTAGEFDVTIQFKPGNRSTGQQREVQPLGSDEQDALANALKALGMLGGLGGRSRKGWGSLTLLELEINRKGQEIRWTAPGTRLDLESELVRLLSPSSGVTSRPSYSAFWRQSTAVVGDPHRSADVAHENLANDYKDAVKNPAEDASYKQDFGLPRGKNTPRRASPVWLHVHQASQSAPAFPVATLFVSDFLDGASDAPHSFIGPTELLSRVAGTDNGD